MVESSKPQISQQKINDSRIFYPTRKVAWLIGVEKYEKVRKQKVNYLDLNQTP